MQSTGRLLRTMTWDQFAARFAHTKSVEDAWGLLQRSIRIYCNEPLTMNETTAHVTKERFTFYLKLTRHEDKEVASCAASALTSHLLNRISPPTFLQYEPIVEASEALLEFLDAAPPEVRTPWYFPYVSGYLTAIHSLWCKPPHQCAVETARMAHENAQRLAGPLVSAMCSWSLAHLLADESQGLRLDAAPYVEAFIRAREYDPYTAFKREIALLKGGPENPTPHALEKGEAERRATLALFALKVKEAPADFRRDPSLVAASAIGG